MSHRSERAPILTGHYYNKHASGHPFVRWLVKRYARTLQEWVSGLGIRSALEIGSGEGYILSYVHAARPDLRLTGSDLTVEMAQVGRAQMGQADWCVTRGEQLPFGESQFDLCLACEVLEHVPEPEAVLEEMGRVTRDYIIVSVPDEPLWRVLNVMRGRYLGEWGNTPGHLHHWSAKDIRRAVGKHLKVLQVARPAPWVFVLAQKK